MTDQKLSELVRLILSGDMDAFEELYNETIGGVYRTLYFLSGGSRHDAEDIAQNVYMELYRSFNKFESNRSLHSWLYGITVRQFQAHKRKCWKEKRNQQKEREVQAEKPISESILDQFKIDENDFVMVEINKLPEKLKQVLILRYVNDLSQQEIADGLSIPLGTVKSRLNQALLRMRKSMGREQYAEK